MDKLYNILAMLMSFVTITLVKVAVKIGKNTDASALFAYLFWFPFIFTLLKYFREMRVIQDKWDGAIQILGVQLLKPLKTPHERLRNRLIYLTTVSTEFVGYLMSHA